MAGQLICSWTVSSWPGRRQRDLTNSPHLRQRSSQCQLLLFEDGKEKSIEARTSVEALCHSHDNRSELRRLL